jgi:hypothetical protein
MPRGLDGEIISRRPIAEPKSQIVDGSRYRWNHDGVFIPLLIKETPKTAGAHTKEGIGEISQSGEIRRSDRSQPDFCGEKQYLMADERRL